MKVFPALLANDEDDYRRKIAQSASIAPFVQIDFMDGVFVPSRSVDAARAAGVEVPFDHEIHLMVTDPLEWLGQLANPRLKRVIFHVEAVDAPAVVAAAIRRRGYPAFGALNPGTGVDGVRGLLPHLDGVLVMAVNPGFYGSPFIPEVLGKIPAVKRLAPDLEVGVDGGMSEETLPAAAAAGADYVCVGSRIFKDPEPPAAYARLARLAEGG